MTVNAATAMVNENIGILTQAEKLITDLDEALYADNRLPPFQSGVGKHIRHVLDFYQAFLSAENGRIDYDRRERSVAVESDRMQAVKAIRHIIQRLESVRDADRKVMSNNDDGGRRKPEHTFSISSIGRELQFLASHTIHHFAIIAMVLIQQGYTPPEDFGVAASTLTHWQETGHPQHA